MKHIPPMMRVAVERAMREDETIEATIIGASNDAIILTSRQAMVVRFEKKRGKSDPSVATWPLDEVQGISLSRGLGAGIATLETTHTKKRRGLFAHGYTDNEISVSRREWPAVEEAVTWLMRRRGIITSTSAE